VLHEKATGRPASATGGSRGATGGFGRRKRSHSGSILSQNLHAYPKLLQQEVSDTLLPHFYIQFYDNFA